MARQRKSLRRLASDLIHVFGELFRLSDTVSGVGFPLLIFGLFGWQVLGVSVQNLTYETAFFKGVVPVQYVLVTQGLSWTCRAIRIAPSLFEISPISDNANVRGWQCPSETD